MKIYILNKQKNQFPILLIDSGVKIKFFFEYPMAWNF